MAGDGIGIANIPEFRFNVKPLSFSAYLSNKNIKSFQTYCEKFNNNIN